MIKLVANVNTYLVSFGSERFPLGNTYVDSASRMDERER